MKKTKANRKFKIRKSVRNRFQITKTGKVLKMQSFNRHLKRKKSKRQLRRLKNKKIVSGRWARKVKKLLGKN